MAVSDQFLCELAVRGINITEFDMDPEAGRKYSYLDDFKIIKTLSCGYHAKVQLALGTDHALYAIKRYNSQTTNLAALETELAIMGQLKHQNLVQLIDVRKNATYKKKDDSSYQCFATILEYMERGELFDFIAQTGKLSQPISRAYFHQMMNAVHHVHSKGFTHRGIKPENILLSKDFQLKLTDFGLSGLLSVKDNTGLLYTKLGSEGYLAPEVASKSYEGSKVDVFASGVVLFVMYAGHPPFEKAALTDPYYRLIKDKKYTAFWKAHERRKTPGFFNDDFKSLFVAMCSFNPQQRPSVQAISKHPWVIKEASTLAQIKEEFEQRFKQVQQNLTIRKQEEEKKRKTHTSSSNVGLEHRGKADVDAHFMEIYESEQDKDRNIPKFQFLSPGDITIEQNIVYAFALFRDFFKHSKVLIEPDQTPDEEQDCLRAVEVQDLEHSIWVKYEHSFEVENEQFSETMEMSVKFGQWKQGLLVVRMELEKGQELYFRRVRKSIEWLVAYCQK